MATNMQVFTQGDKTIRVLGDSENPLFCLSDVCKALDIQNPIHLKNAIMKEFEGYTLDVYPLKTAGGTQNFIFITEPQLYFVLMRSDKPKAKPFRQWVVNDVLPSIRKHGFYTNPSFSHQSQSDEYITLHKDFFAHKISPKQSRILMCLLETRNAAGYLLLTSAYRKAIAKECDSSVASLNNTLKDFVRKGILKKDSMGYQLNTELICNQHKAIDETPTTSLPSSILEQQNAFLQQLCKQQLKVFEELSNALLKILEEKK